MLNKILLTMFGLLVLCGCKTSERERFAEPLIYSETVDDYAPENQFITKYWLSYSTGWVRQQIVEKTTKKILFTYEYNSEMEQSRIGCDSYNKCDFILYYIEQGILGTEHCIIAPLNYEGGVRDNPMECR